jgi:hypothetical protein
VIGLFFVLTTPLVRICSACSSGTDRSHLAQRSAQLHCAEPPKNVCQAFESDNRFNSTIRSVHQSRETSLTCPVSEYVL